MKRPTFVVLDGKVASDRMIAVDECVPPGLILLGKEELMEKFCDAVYKKGFEAAAKQLPAYELDMARSVMNELIRNGYRIIGVGENGVKVGLSVYPEGMGPLPPARKDDVEIVEGVELSKSGLDGLGKLMGAKEKAVEWAARMIQHIKSKQEVPF